MSDDRASIELQELVDLDVNMANSSIIKLRFESSSSLLERQSLIDAVNISCQRENVLLLDFTSSNVKEYFDVIGDFLANKPNLNIEIQVKNRQLRVNSLPSKAADFNSLNKKIFESWK